MDHNRLQQFRLKILCDAFLQKKKQKKTKL